MAGSTRESIYAAVVSLSLANDGQGNLPIVPFKSITCTSIQAIDNLVIRTFPLFLSKVVVRDTSTLHTGALLQAKVPV